MRVTTIPAGVSRPDLGLLQGTDLFAGDDRRDLALAVGVEWIREQQWPSLTHGAVEAGDVRRWVDEPLDLLGSVVRGRRARAGLAVLRRRLTRELSGSMLVLGDLQGEIRPGMWWFEETAAEVAVVDGWHPSVRGLPEIDVVLLVLAARSLAAGRAPDDVTSATRAVLEAGWSDDEQVALGTRWANNQALQPSTIVLLAWLHAMASVESGVGGTSRSDRMATMSRRREVRSFLEGFAPESRNPVVPVEAAVRVVRLPQVAPSRAVTTAAAVQVAMIRAERRTATRQATRRTVLGISLASVLWLVGTYHLDPTTMTDLGLLSILRPPAYLALAVLLGCFAMEITRPEPATWRAAAPLVALVAALHGTPAWLYGTLRYSWAWKHLGIIDYIHRHGAVDPHAQALDVYHSWPGFFALNSALTDLFGLDTAVQYARWWPVLANLATIPALLFVYRGLRGGEDRRTGWVAVALFLVADWIGQDYFSPQSMGFLLYLVVIGVALRRSAAKRAGDDVAAQRWTLAIALIAAAAIITSHQITPVVLALALVAVTLTGRRQVRWVAGAVLAMVGVWAVTGARAFVSSNVADFFEGFGEPVANADGNLVDQGRLASEQVLVSTMGRLVLVAIVLLAGVGVVRQMRRSQYDRAALALIVAPGVILFANKFGGEIGFRAYLFALPFLAWYGALALQVAARTGAVPSRVRVRQGLAIFVASSVLLSGFLFGYFGKDRWYSFTGGEVAASGYVLEHARSGSLLVTVTANYPGQWLDYEHLTYVPIANEDAAGRRRVLADPADVLAGWLGEGAYKDGYILLTRSQEDEVEALGVLPPGAVARLRKALEASPKFRVAYDDPDAQVFVLADR